MNETMLHVVRKLRSRAGGILLVCSDGIALAGAFILSLWLRYDELLLSAILNQHVMANYKALTISLLFYLIVFHSFRLYRYAWRFASLETVSSVVWANTAGILFLIITLRLFSTESYPRSVLAVFWVLSIAIVGGLRICLRLASLGTNYGRRGAIQRIKRDTPPRRVVVMGSGPTAARLLNHLRDEVSTDYEVVGVLDDAPTSEGTFIRNTRVLGPLSHLHTLLEERAIDEVLIALQDTGGAKIREYALACRSKNIPVKVIPALSDVLNGRGQTHMEEISVEDLLRRPPVRINMDRIGGCISGARVLVTGAGGSIGSELCRQILALDPSSLILLGHGENSIHDIYHELRRTFPARANRLKMVVASVADEVRMDQVFRFHRPQVVFHAAAHKHVPIMEVNLMEAVQNNVLGTNCVAECCGRYGVEKMVLISTDKAVSPSSVMGATKWLCEEVVRSMVNAYPRTKFLAVRFGNVLGSRGSVVPIFHDAIRKGGPVNVTHPEMTRYFMSIPEAVQLVLQAGASGESGELFLLDMGQPVKILDLACDMIRLCGYEPYTDIPICFTGIRPGEKLHEALTSENEDLRCATCEGLFVVQRPSYYSEAQIEELLQQMRRVMLNGNSLEMRDTLDQYVPGFCGEKLFAPDTPTLKIAEG